MTRRPVGHIRWLREGVARIELSNGRDRITGERRRMSRTVHGNQADAERVLAQMLLDIGQMPSGKGLTVERFIEDIYKPWLVGHVRRSTREGYEDKLDRHVLPRFGKVRLDGLEPYVLDVWRDDLLTKMSAQSALHVYRAFSTALNRATRWHLIAANPLKAVEPPHPPERPVAVLDASEARTYVAVFTGHELAPAIVLAMSTGLRPCEVAGLTWADLDLQAATVTVKRGLHEAKGGEVWFEDPKSARSARTVSLPAWAVETLRPLRGIGPIVPDNGTHMRPTKMQRLYRKHLHAAKVRYVPMRDLRHTHATLMLEAGVDIVVVSRRLGHSTVAITDKHYLRPRRSADQAAADAFEHLFTGRATASDSARQATASDNSTPRDGIR